MGALTQALPSVDHEFSKGAAAEVKKLLRAMVFFINRVTSGEGKKKQLSARRHFYQWRGLWRFFANAGVLYTCGVCLR